MCKSCILSPDILNRLNYDDNNEAVRDREDTENETRMNSYFDNELSQLAER